MKLSAPWYAVLSIDGTIASVDLNFCTTKIAQGLKLITNYVVKLRKRRVLLLPSF
jgi:hypothetical protein